MCTTTFIILLGKLSPQYYWMFCSFVLFFNFLSNTLCIVFIYFVADRDISRQTHSQKTPWLQVDCCMRNKLSTFHLKEKEYTISATHKPGQKAHPKSAVGCSCTVRSTLCICLLLIYFLSPAFISTPGTCRPCNLSPLQ